MRLSYSYFGIRRSLVCRYSTGMKASNGIIHSEIFFLVFCLIEISDILNPKMARIYLFIVLTSLFAYQSMASCSRDSKLTWIDNPIFTKTFQTCSRKAVLLRSSINKCLSDGIKKLTGGYSLEPECVECFTTSFNCVVKNCMAACMRGAGSDGCLTCNTIHCNPQLMICTGVQSDQELPPPPSNK